MSLAQYKLLQINLQKQKEEEERRRQEEAEKGSNATGSEEDIE